MAEHLLREGASFEMHYCARSAETMAFREKLIGSELNVHLHLDDGPPEQQLRLAPLLATADASTHLYVCGPKGFMDAVLSAARAAGWSEDRLHYEFFAREVVHTHSDSAFEVELASSGRVIAVPRDRTVVEALRAAGVEMSVSCEQGVCGTCLTRVLEGTPDHRDSYLTADERAANDQFTPCCSRAISGRLILDL
jgi:vanillate monooxygenase ferredoxin subunit